MALKIISHRFRVRYLNYLCYISNIEFFSKSRVYSAFLCRKFNFFIKKLEIFRVMFHTSPSGAVDKVSSHHAEGHAFESRSELLFFIKKITFRRVGRLSTPCPGGVDFAHAQTG